MWADNDQNLGVLKIWVENLETKTTSSMQEVLLEENKALRAKYSTERLTIMLQEFNKTDGIREAILPLQRQIDKIISRSQVDDKIE